MKASTQQTFTEVHTWTGLGAGLALFIAFYAGAFTIFHHELDSWDTWSASTPVSQGYQDAQQLVDMAVASNPGITENLRLNLASEHGESHLVRSFKRREDGSFERFEYRLTPDNGLDNALDSSRLADFVYLLHYTAGIPNDSRIGIYTLGFICVLYGMALVTGVLIFLPNFFKDLFIVRKGRNLKRFWLDAHNVVGVLSLPWHIMFAWSSALLAIGVLMLAPFQFLVFDEDLLTLVGPELGAVEQAAPTGENVQPLPVTALVAASRQAMPEMDPVYLRYQHYGDSNGTVTLIGPVDAETLAPRASLTLNSATGEVLAVEDPAQATVGSTFYRGLIALHFVDFGGYLIKWVYFLLTLAGAFLFYSGNLLWVESRRRRRQHEQPGKTIFLARLNSGVCIGCMAGISAAFITSRLLMEHVNRGDLTEWAYYAVFLGAVFWAMARPVVAGAYELLVACAALTLAIPIVDALVLGMPPWISLAQGQWILFSVELAALLFGLAFWQMARAVKRRSITGQSNSVWADANSKTQPTDLPATAESA